MGENIIDPNFGFTANNVVAGFSGSDLMRYEKLASEFFYKALKIYEIYFCLYNMHGMKL